MVLASYFKGKIQAGRAYGRTNGCEEEQGLLGKNRTGVPESVQLWPSLPRDEETQGGIEGGGSHTALRVMQGHLMVSDRALRRRGLLLDWENMLEAVEARLWDSAEGHTRFNL